MMRLHEDKEQFNSMIQSAAITFGYGAFQVEKDYYVSLLLKQLVERVPSLVFKGGTSLSKCYTVIKRFSEDLDLSVPLETGQKKKLKEDIIAVIHQAGFQLLNQEDIRSGREFNEYKIAYEKNYSGDNQMSPHLLVETNVAFQPYPFEERSVSNLITDFVMGAQEPQTEKKLFLETYDMHPFQANVQSIERTFLDKLFALCDYYEKNESTRYSRHLYDVHKIWNSEYLDIQIIEKILPEVITIRQTGNHTLSCKPDYPLKETLQTIINSSFYKRDYLQNTSTFLAEEVAYEETIQSLTMILNQDLLPKKI